MTPDSGGRLSRSSAEVVERQWSKGLSLFGSSLTPTNLDWDDRQLSNKIGRRWSDYIFPDKNPNVKMGYINRLGEIVWTPSWQLENCRQQCVP